MKLTLGNTKGASAEYTALAADLDERLRRVHKNRRAHAMHSLAAPQSDILIPLALRKATAALIHRQHAIAAIAGSIGSEIQELLHSPPSPRDNIVLGLFVLESFVNLGYMSLTKQYPDSQSKHKAHCLLILNEAKLSALFQEVCIGNEATGILPAKQPPQDWSGALHVNGASIIKMAPKKVLGALSPTTQPLVFKTLNVKQNTGWKINKPMLAIYTRLTRQDDTSLLSYKDGHAAMAYLLESDAEAKKSKRLEANTIKRIAKHLGDSTFYHQYQYDFRGRVYPTSAFLHEQGSDNARCLLEFAEPAPLGKDGLFWLYYYAATCWGFDKALPDARVEYASKYLSEWLDFANDPLVKRDWMKADKPLQFLRVCLEILALDNCVGLIQGAHESADEHYARIEEFQCALPIHFDGTTNGSQWIAALLRDKEVGELVNLTPKEVSGDLYTYIADSVFAEVEKDHNPALDAAYADICKKTTGRYMKKADIDALVDSVEGCDSLEDLAPNFWLHATKRERREVVKRPIMTMSYGVTMRGMMDQILKDTPAMSPRYAGMPHAWATYLAKTISKCAETRMPCQNTLLGLLRTVAREVCAKGGRVDWVVPATGFPVRQNYKKFQKKDLRVEFCGMQISISYKDFTSGSVDKVKQVRSITANKIHSLDASHVMLFACEATFPTSTIHDSFGMRAGDAAEAFVLIRETFVKINEQPILQRFLEHHGCPERTPEMGDLDIKQVLDADLSFS